MHEPRIFVYILASRRYGYLYTGLTTHLIKRMHEHREGLADGYTKEYEVKTLVYYEIHTDMQEAAHRERLLKKWKRQWKFDLIEKSNPNWYDLYEDVLRKWN